MALLGALSLFAAAPAQAQTPVWSATLTVQDISNGFFGCNSQNLCATYLTDDDFTYEGTTYTVEFIVTNPSNQLNMGLDNAIPTALKFGVGSVNFPLGDAVLSGGGTIASWNNAVLGWSAGDTVSLSLTAPGTNRRVNPPPPPPPPLSSDASLRNIEISHGELEFSRSGLSYEVAVGYGPQKITVTPETNHFRASVRINGEDAVSGESMEISLNQDEPTVIKIEVTAQNGRKQVYTITVTRCGMDDGWALARLYEATGGDTWHENGNWNSTEPLGQWFGVKTDEDGRVISLRLEGNGLSGEILRELICLSQLRELALWDNDGLSGDVPEELVLAVERAVLRDVAGALELNPGWFDTYEDPFAFGNWHGGVTTDEEGRVTELDFTGEGITGEVPGSVFEFRRLGVIETECGVTLEVEAPEGVSVLDGCGGGCDLGSGDSSVFGLFLVTLLAFAAFAALGRKRVRG